MANARVFPIVCILYLAACLGLQTHGFSLGIWGDILQRPEISETWAGKNRANRSDDWMGLLPLVLSQTQHEPAFPKINTLIHPDGQNMVFGVSAPVWHWSTLFKPHVWGYFLSPDFGLSWHWNFRVVALALSAYFFFRLIFQASAFSAAIGALCLTSSSFFAYWSFISEPLTSLALASCILTHLILHSPRPLLWVLALSWTAASFCLSSLYPPFQIPLLYFSLFVGAAQFASNQSAFNQWPLKKLALVLSAILIAGALVAVHFWQNTATIELLTNTAYPGQRVSTGGSLSLSHFFHLTLLGLSGYSAYSPINISEMGSGFYLGVAFIISSFLHKPERHFTELRRALAALTVIFGVYSFFGIPEFLAKLSLLSYVPASRTLGLWTLLNICWTVYFVSSKGFRTRPLIPVLVLLLIALGAGTLGPQASTHINLAKAVIGSAVVCTVAFCFWKKPQLAWIIFLIISSITSLWFNPINSKTFAKIQASEATSKIKAKMAEENYDSIVFLDKSAAVANLPRMLGIQSYGGLLYPPQLDFFEGLDERGENRTHYNRFAYTSFYRAEKLNFSNPSPDTLLVGVDQTTLNEHFSKTRVIENFKDFLAAP